MCGASAVEVVRAEYKRGNEKKMKHFQPRGSVKNGHLTCESQTG